MMNSVEFCEILSNYFNDEFLVTHFFRVITPRLDTSLYLNWVEYYYTNQNLYYKYIVYMYEINIKSPLYIAYTLQFTVSSIWALYYLLFNFTLIFFLISTNKPILYKLCKDKQFE